MKILIPRERQVEETRVAATPETVRRMVRHGFEPSVEAGAGATAHFPDREYSEAGAQVVDDARGAWGTADVVLKVAPPGPEEVEALRPEAVLIGLLAPHKHPDMVRRLAERGVSSLAMELIPRVSRAQDMDALSSQASIAGYKAVLLAASRLDKYFPLLMTAAGTVPPARVVILGAGVAGLQALATAKRLGAVVEVSDIRGAVKEQVESLGGRFIVLPATDLGEGEGGYAREMSEEFLAGQRAVLEEHLAAADVVLTTALVPGRTAPRLVTADMVAAMRPGSVIVDLAGEQGGNCELSNPGGEVDHRGVLILAPLNLPAAMPADASRLYARNLLALLIHLFPEGRREIDPEDEIVRASLVTHRGRSAAAAGAEQLQEVTV